MLTTTQDLQLVKLLNNLKYNFKSKNISTYKINFKCIKNDIICKISSKY